MHIRRIRHAMLYAGVIIFSLIVSFYAPFSSAALAQDASSSPQVLSPAEDVVQSGQQIEQRLAEVEKTDPLAAICFVVGLICVVVIILSFVSVRFKGAIRPLATMGGRFVVLLIGGFALLLPIAMHFPNEEGPGLLWPTLTTAVPAAGYLLFNTLGFSSNLYYWTGVIYDIMGHTLLANLYFWLIVFYVLAGPVMLALTAVDVIVNGFTGVVIYITALKQAFMRRSIYIFSSIDKNSYTLSMDLVQHASKKHATHSMPLLLFCGVDSSKTDEQASYLSQLKQAASGKAFIIATPLSFATLPLYLPVVTQGRCCLTYIAINKDMGGNIEAVSRLTDVLTNQILQQCLRSVQWDAEALSSRNVVQGRALTYIKNLHVWCVHEQDTDYHAFTQQYAPAINPSLERRAIRRSRAHGASSDVQAKTRAALVRAARRIRDSYEINIVSQEREILWDALNDYPLTRVLKPIDITKGEVPYQRLVALVCGLGDKGTAAIKALSWYGRLPGVELRIIAIDDKSEDVARTLAATAAELAKEVTPLGHSTTNLPIKLVGAPPSSNESMPLITYLSAQAISPTVKDLLLGKEVQGFTIQNEKRTEYPIRILPHDAIYAVVCIDDDVQALRCAQYLKQTMLRRDIAQQGTSARSDTKTSAQGPQTENNMHISVGLSKDDINKTHLAQQDDHLISYFGAFSRSFSYKKLIEPVWERATLNLEAILTAYSERGHLARHHFVTSVKARISENEEAPNKLAHLASVRFAEYRMWCLGIQLSESTPHKAECREFEKKLGVFDLLEQSKKDATVLQPLFGGVSYSDTYHKSSTETKTSAQDQPRSDEDTPHIKQLINLQKSLSKRYPAYMMLSELDRQRDIAFKHAEGWEAISGGREDLALAAHMLGAETNHGRALPHILNATKQDFFLIQDEDELVKRAVICQANPQAHARLVTWAATVAFTRHFIVTRASDTLQKSV